MAPVVAALLSLLAAAATLADAKPLGPGRHGDPAVMNMLSTQHKRLSAKAVPSSSEAYYGEERGLTRPKTLPSKRAASLPEGWSYSSCVDESNGQRLLAGASFSSASMTPLLCLTQCQKLGFSLAGTEASDECFCANSKSGSGGSTFGDASCAVPCAGDKSTMCGGYWFLSMYTYTAPASNNSACVTSPVHSTTSTVSVVSTTSTASATSTTSSAAAAHPTHVDHTDSSEWYTLGCAYDNSQSRILDAWQRQYWNEMTTDMCLSQCEDLGYTFAATEWGQECYCGNKMPATVNYDDTGCTMACKGDASDTCGGYQRAEVYELISKSSGNGTVCTTTGTAGTVPTAIASPTKTPLTNNAIALPVPSASTVTPVTGGNIPQSGSPKSVWAHHMVGNTYPYTQSNWANDIKVAQAAGVDGFALNMGSDYWQPDRINDGYTAAQTISPNFKMFLSLDMTVMSCSSWNDGQTLVNLVARWAKHPNQALHNGKVLVSTFAGSDCTFGQGSSNGWQNAFVDQLKARGINIFFVPSIFSDPNSFASNTWMDGELNWNSGWPMGSTDLTNPTDGQYMAALGSKEYMPAISPFFFTHFGANSWNKNWLYRSDDWLYCTRWEQVIAMRDKVSMTELLTWNDFGESSYIGPIDGAMPANSGDWVHGYDHQGLNVLTKYYAAAFKTGAYPAITKDTIVMWTRPHFRAATASADSAGRPTGWDWTDDNLYAVVLTTGPAVVTLTSGSSSQTFAVQGGLSKLKIPSQVGGISGSIARGGQTVASYNGGSFSYTNNPVTYNYNYFVGSSS